MISLIYPFYNDMITLKFSNGRRQTTQII